MLQRIRDNASGPIAYAVVALISLVFGVWGIGSYFTDSPNPVVAKVGGTEITKYQLQQAYDQRYQRLQQLMGENFKHDLVDPDNFRRDVLDGLIQQAALSQYADDQGYRVTDRELLEKLSSDSRFQVDGEFSAERYRALLSQARVSPGTYEANVRHDVQIDQVRGGVLDTSFVTQREIALIYRLEHQRRKFSYLQFKPDDFADAVEISDADVENYYHEHSQQYLTPERVKLSFVDVDRSKLTPAEKPEEKYLQAIYDQEKDARFKTPERRKARHILIRIDDDTDEDAAREQIQKLAKKLDEGADFAELAKENSDDESTAKKGGELDWVSRGTMVAPFEQALFELKPDSISKPVRTDFGWHLIQLEEIEPAKVKPFEDEEVQAELLDIYSGQERDERFRQMTERLDSLSFEAPESLKPLAEELQLDIQTTDWVTRDGEDATGLGKYAAVRDATFSDSVLKDRLNSTPIQLSGDRQVVVRVADEQAAEQRPLAEVGDGIRKQLRAEGAAAKARASAEAALQSLRDGKAFDTVAADTKAQTQTPGWVARSSKDVPGSLLTRVFALPHPQSGQASYGLAEMPQALAVLELTAVEQAKSADDDQTDRSKIARDARGRVAGSEYDAFRQAMQKDISIDVNEDKIN